MQTGDIVGNYILDEKLGEGAFGEVWKAVHRDVDDWLVAIKIPKVPEYLNAFRKEARFQHDLDHPSIVKIIELQLHDEPAHMVMELVDGKSLRTILREKGALCTDDAVHIFREACRALAHAHEKGIVHRDLKPGNILIKDSGEVKLTDFGLSKFEISEASLKLSLGSIAGVSQKDIVGTLDYMSPEQRKGKDVDHRADIYSLGQMLFEMLAGKLPMGYGDVPSDYAENLPPVFDRIYTTCCARLDKRYENIAAIISELDGGTKPEIADDNRTINVTTTSLSIKQLNELRRLTDEIEEASEPIRKQREIADQVQFIRHNMIHLERKVQGDRIRRKTDGRDDDNGDNLSENEKDLERLRYRLGALENELATIDSRRQEREGLLDERRILLDDISVPVVIPLKSKSRIALHGEQIKTIDKKFNRLDRVKKSFRSAASKLKRAFALLANAKGEWSTQKNIARLSREDYIKAKLSGVLSDARKKVHDAETTLKEIDFSGKTGTVAIPHLDSIFSDFIHGWSKTLLNARMIDSDRMIQSQINKLNQRADDIGHIKQLFQNEQSLIQNEIDELIVESETITVRKLIEHAASMNHSKEKQF